jgi:MinD-like ATPase involved in chromosome partitioning or flagellar assembly
MGKSIAIISGKGGVGKTTTAINLSYAFNVFQRNVVLLEANLKTPHIGVLLGFPSVEKTFHSILEGRHKIYDSAYLHYSGLKVIIANFSGKHKIIDPKHYDNFSNALSELKDRVELVVIDTPPSHVDETFFVLKHVDYVIAVTTPEITSVLEAMKSLKLAQHLKRKILGVVVTRRTGKDYELSIDNIEKLTEYRVIGIIPEDDNVPMSNKLKHPVVFAYPDADASIAYKKLAAYLLGKEYKEKLPDKEDPFEKLVSKL